MPQADAPIKTPLAQRMVDFRYRMVPLIVWSLASVVVIVMLSNRARSFDYVGMAQSVQYEISPSEDGSVQAVFVELYQEVEPGDIVARLDDSQLTAQLRTAEATIAQLNAEIEASRIQAATEQGLENASWTADLRRFQADEESRRLEALELRVEIESDEIEHERLDLELRRIATLLDAGLISPLDLENVRLMRDQVGKRIEENRRLLAETEQEFATARARRERFEDSLPRLPAEEPLLRPIREAINVESRRLDEIEILRTHLVLRSPVAGRVTQLLGREGQTVLAGEAVAMITEPSVREIVAFIGQDDEQDVRPSTPVLVARARGSGPAAESVVIRVGPSVEVMPQRLWSDPRFPDYGRAIVIAAAPGLDLVPGEIVRIKLRSPD